MNWKQGSFIGGVFLLAVVGMWNATHHKLPSLPKDNKPYITPTKEEQITILVKMIQWIDSNDDQQCDEECQKLKRLAQISLLVDHGIILEKGPMPREVKLIDNQPATLFNTPHRRPVPLDPNLRLGLPSLGIR